MYIPSKFNKIISSKRKKIELADLPITYATRLYDLVVISEEQYNFLVKNQILYQFSVEQYNDIGLAHYGKTHILNDISTFKDTFTITTRGSAQNAFPGQTVYVNNDFYGIGTTYGGYIKIYIQFFYSDGKSIGKRLLGSFTCLTENTLVMMADYNQKKIKDIQVGDYILTINQQTGQLQKDIVLINNGNKEVYFNEYDIWYFEDNYKVQTVSIHRFYNVDRKAFIYMNQWQIGQRVRTYDGKQLRLIGHQIVKKRSQAYSLIVKNNTYIANGMFTGTRSAKGITPFDR